MADTKKKQVKDMNYGFRRLYMATTRSGYVNCKRVGVMA
jgi:hypothetical protein